jgi:lipopolysaccharide export system permease protein
MPVQGDVAGTEGRNRMRLLSRYVFRQTAGALLLILISLTGVTWIAIALRQLELMTTQGQDVVRFLGMTSLAIPSLIAFIAPMALLIASIHVLNKLNGDSELIVMTAGGMPAWSLLKPLGLLALLVSIAVAAVNHIAGPWSQRTLKDMVVQVRSDFMSQVLQPWRFSSPEANLTVHIRDRAPNGDLLGLMLHDARDPKQVVTYLAERGQIIKQGPSVFLRMERGHVLRRLENEPAPQIISFQSYPVDLNRIEQRTDQVQALRPRERYTSDLMGPDRHDPQYKANPARFLSELHERFSNPLYAFAFVLIVVAFVGQAQTTRSNRMQAIVTAFSVAVGCRILGIAAANAAAVRTSAIYLLYLVPVGASLASVLMIQWHISPRRQTRLARALEASVDSVRALFRNLKPRPRRPAGAPMTTRS